MKKGAKKLGEWVSRLALWGLLAVLVVHVVMPAKWTWLSAGQLWTLIVVWFIFALLAVVGVLHRWVEAGSPTGKGKEEGD